MKRVTITNRLVLLLFWSNVNNSETGSSAALPWSDAAHPGVGLVPLLQHVGQPWLWFMMGHRTWLVTLPALTDGAALVSAGWTRIHHLRMLGPPPISRGSLLSDEPGDRCWTLSPYRVN